MVQVYNYLIETNQLNRELYRPSKRNELKKVYSSIVNLSKRSPFYKVNLSKENQDYTIGVKELAIALKSKINEMSDPLNADFHSKAVSVSDDHILSAELLNDKAETFPEDVTIKVQTLASNQINRGKELLQPSRGLEYGEYQFTAKVMDKSYNLTFIQPGRLENKDALQNMAKYLNDNLPGITATVENGSKPDYSRLVLTSGFTGKSAEKAFSFEDDEIYKVGVVDYFGLNRMEKAPSNAEFELNKIKKQTLTNKFNIENTIQVTLNDTGETPVSLRIVPDKKPILKSVDSFIRSFNGLIKIAKSRTEETKEHYGASKLINEMKNLEDMYQDELEACGMKTSENGMLTLDDSLAVQACEDGGMESLFTRENGFIAKVRDKAEAITINPIDYLDKTVVTYPNNQKAGYTNPYITSMYSGLLFNSYC